MKKLLFLSVALLYILTFAGCNSIKQNFISKIGVERVVSVSGSPFDLLTVSISFRNETTHPITVKEAQASVYLEGNKVATATLSQEITVPARATTTVPCPLSMNVIDPLKGVVVVAKFKRKSYEGMTVDYAAKIKMMGASRVISGQNTPVTNFASILKK